MLLEAQTLPSSRIWRSDERTFLTDLSVVTALAATRTTVYAATFGGLAIYDRGLLRWRETIGLLEGFPSSTVRAMVADPNDDTAWLAGPGFWARFENFGRRIQIGTIPSAVDQVVLDARDPSRGAWFRSGTGWYFVPRGGLVAAPAGDVPPPGNRLTSLNYTQLVARLPALDAVRFRIERDEQNYSHRITAAAVAPLTGEVYVGTDGNGSFKVDQVTYGLERLPAGVLGTSTGAVAAWRGQICAASDARVANPRRGITCLDEGLGPFIYYEGGTAAGLPLASVRALLVTERAVWAATDQGVVRAPRRGGRPQQLMTRDGLPSNDVTALAPGPDGVWVGTSGGLALVADSGRSAVVTSRASGPPVLALAATGADTLWAGTTAGLVAFLLPVGGPVVSFGEVLGSLREPVVSLALRGDTIVAASEARFSVRSGGEWRTVDVPGRPVGTIARVVSDERAGFWVAGSQGFAYYDPARNVWNALTSPGDVPLPVRDIAVSRNYAWVATELGLVRYDRRILAP